MYDVIIIGAGAAGMMAAGTAAQNGKKVLVIEKMEKAGGKIRITGKGRCNLPHARPQQDANALHRLAAHCHARRITQGKFRA